MKFNEFYMDKVIRYVVAARNLDYQYSLHFNFQLYIRAIYRNYATYLC